MQSYITKSNNAKVKSNSQKDKPKASYLIQYISNITGQTEIQLVQQEVKKQVAKSHYENISLKIKQEMGNYDAIYGNKTAIDCFSRIYAKVSLEITKVNAWKEKFFKKVFPFTGQKKRKTKSCG